MSIEIERDVKFDRYGDISFIGNDIDILIYEEDILYQNVVDRLITNFADYPLSTSVGADLSGLIGKNNNSLLEFQLKAKVTKSLTSDGFLSESEVSVLTLRENEKIYLRITIFGNEGYSLTERFKVSAIYNTSSGLLHATN